MAEIYSPRHYSEIYYPPHYRAGSTDPETHCNARCRTATLQAIPSPVPVQCHRHHNPKLSSILASAANFGNYPHFKARMCKPGGSAKGGTALVLFCAKLFHCGVLCAKLVVARQRGVKCAVPLISEKYCPQIVAAMSPPTKQKSPSLIILKFKHRHKYKYIRKYI